MQQENITSITLQGPEEEDQYIKLIEGNKQNQALRLNLQQARKLASELIQLVHQAEVRNNLKRNKQKVIQPAVERIGTPFILSSSHQA